MLCASGMGSGARLAPFALADAGSDTAAQMHLLERKVQKLQEKVSIARMDSRIAGSKIEANKNAPHFKTSTSAHSKSFGQRWERKVQKLREKLKNRAKEISLLSEGPDTLLKNMPLIPAPRDDATAQPSCEPQQSSQGKRDGARER